MKISGFFHGILINDKICLKCADPKDLLLVKKLFTSKSQRENRSQKEILLKCEIDAQFQHRSYKQLNSVWKLVTVIFQNDSENHRLPTEQEKYDLYLDLLELYADKIPNRFTGQLRSIHISESNTLAAAHFIDGLLYHIATQCNLPTDLEATVRSVLYEWEIWRGTLEEDINDHRTVQEMRKFVVYSEASGIRCNNLHFHHIVTRGACPAAIDCAWNLVALTPEEHNFYHQQCKNWDEFLYVYPHLKNKVERAQRKCSELMQEKNSIKYLAKMALE